MKPTLVYIHGYGATGDSETGRNLRMLLTHDFNVVTPGYNGSNPIEAARVLEDIVIAASSGKIVIAGLSLGGFFANYLGRKHNHAAVLVNPSLMPSQSLAKFHKAQPILDAYVRLEAEERTFTSKPPRKVLVGLEDDILDPAENGLAMKDVADVTAIPMGHCLDAAYYGLLAQLICEIGEKA